MNKNDNELCVSFKLHRDIISTHVCMLDNDTTWHNVIIFEFLIFVFIMRFIAIELFMYYYMVLLMLELLLQYVKQFSCTGASK